MLNAVHTFLAGFFAFAAIHYTIKWWSSRRERIFLAFSIQCAGYTCFCLAMGSFLRARTIPDVQAAMDRFVTIGVLIHAGFLPIYALLSGRRDRAFGVIVAGTLVCLAVLNQWSPLRGTVIALKPIRLAWGEPSVIPIRTPPGVPLALLYVAVLATYGYGFVAARAIWGRDRAGAVLVALASTAVVGGAALGFVVDFMKVRAPFAGAWPHVLFVLGVSISISREYAARGARIAASERRTESALRETQAALADLQAEQRRREEAEADRQQTVEALVRAQRTELTSQLAASMAHDFNNVLSVISVWSSVMKSPSRSAADEASAEQALAEAHQQGLALSRQLRTLAQTGPRSVTRFSLDRPIRDTLVTLTPALLRGIDLQFEAPAAPEVEANETEIQQLVYNLVLNARDAMPSGGTIQVTAGLETSPIPIRVAGGALAAGTWAMVTVKDSGTGIDPAIRDRLFDLFFTTKGQRGTGLGLATVQRIAKASGGGVAVETDPSSGATFKVYLPRVST
jgi:signal transduction histidine kinase